jgi:hypothetical protein
MVLTADEAGVTVVRQLAPGLVLKGRPRRVAWADISRFEDGGGWDSELGSELGFSWQLVIVLQTGKMIKGYHIWSPAPETVAAIRQVAERHGIPADLTGFVIKDRKPVIEALRRFLVAFMENTSN